MGGPELIMSPSNFTFFSLDAVAFIKGPYLRKERSLLVKKRRHMDMDG